MPTVQPTTAWCGRKGNEIPNERHHLAPNAAGRLLCRGAAAAAGREQPGLHADNDHQAGVDEVSRIVCPDNVKPGLKGMGTLPWVARPRSSRPSSTGKAPRGAG